MDRAGRDDIDHTPDTHPVGVQEIPRALRDLVAFQELITGTLRRFADLPPEALDVGIDEALREIGEFVGVDRSYVFRLSPDATWMSNTHEWCADGIDPQIDELQDMSTEPISWWLPRMRAGEPVHVPRVRSLAEDRAAERELLEPLGIQSIVAVPMLSGDRLMGFIGFDAVRRERAWSHGEQVLLRAVADVVVGGLTRREAFEALSHSEQRFRALVQHSSDLVMIVDEEPMLGFLGPSAHALLGWDPQASVGTSFTARVHPEDVGLVRAALGEAYANPGRDVDVPDHRLRHADGTWRWFLATAVDLSSDGTVGGVVLNAHDITERKTAEEALRFQAVHDPLTGLPNRLLLLERLTQALSRSGRMGQPVALVFIDLDRFKLVNDSLGHGVGDELLREASRRLRTNVRPGDIVARFGGDEFIVLLHDVLSPESAVRSAERLMEAFSEPYNLSGRQHFVTASAGVVMWDGISDAATLVRDADAAMYEAKDRGRDRIEVFDSALHERLLRRIDLVGDLRQGLARDELSLVYQPLFDLSTGGIVGTEALVRWRHPTRGPIMPADFIPLAEENGLIVPMGEWVLGKAVEQVRRWRDERPQLEPLAVTVNLSVRQLTQTDLPGTVMRLLDEHDVAPDQLCLELTESALMAEPEAALAVLSQLRDIGVGLAIDDFGTGYSSLAYLRNLPVTTLKIDRSFVTGLGQDERDARVIAAIIGLAHEFGLTTVAEGVETAKQLRALRHLGCDMTQGFYLLPPGDAGVMSDLRAAVLPGAAHFRGRGGLVLATG